MSAKPFEKYNPFKAIYLSEKIQKSLYITNYKKIRKNQFTCPPSELTTSWLIGWGDMRRMKFKIF